MKRINSYFCTGKIISILTFSLLFTGLHANLTQTANPNRLSIFLDMPRWADEDYIRQEISLSDYVRDKDLANVHIIMSRHPSGASGTIYAISFIGYDIYKNMNYELSYWDDATNTSDETRIGYTKLIKIGIAPYMAKAGMLDQMSLQYTRPRKSWSMKTPGEIGFLRDT